MQRVHYLLRICCSSGKVDDEGLSTIRNDLEVRVRAFHIRYILIDRTIKLRLHSFIPLNLILAIFKKRSYDCISLPNTRRSDPVKVLSQERKQSHSNVYWKIVVAIVLYV